MGDSPTWISTLPPAFSLHRSLQYPYQASITLSGFTYPNNYRNAKGERYLVIMVAIVIALACLV